jgi:3-deoxy-7-phosphoheptulonate synthase
MSSKECHISRIKPLISPDVLIEQIPIDEEIEQFIEKTRADIADIIGGRGSRQLLVIGPCSIHQIDSALEYAHKLKYLAQELDERYLIVMRVYFEKPRTRVGWKGFINDPNLNGNHDINSGLYKARKLLLKINQIRVPCGVEFLDTITPQYIADLVVWGAIGARTVESQVHRQLASGLSMPVGFKNSTYGYIDTAVDAVISARSSHSFMGITKQGIAGIVMTKGNPWSHIILRGGSKTGPNYGEEFIREYQKHLEEAGISTGLIIDCSHGNSQKNYLRQMDVFNHLRSTEQPMVRGFMIESNINEGHQSLNLEQLQYGVSITDGCLSWQQSYQLLIRHQIYLIRLSLGVNRESEDQLEVSASVNQPELELEDRVLQDFPVVLGSSSYYCLFLPLSFVDERIETYPDELLQVVSNRLVRIPFTTEREASKFFGSFAICLNVLEEYNEIVSILLENYGMFYLPDKTSHLYGIVLETATGRIVKERLFPLA